jgi:hypothetical protein
MTIAAAVIPLLLGAGPSIPWTRDFTTGYAQAEERTRPLLVFFRTDCGGGNTPTNPISAGGPVTHQEGLSPCDRMQQDVWEHPSVVSAAERFTAVLIDGGDQTLAVRYQVVRTPTTLVTDPWGNEILRVSGYFERDRTLRLLRAIPEDFKGLAAAGKVLQANGRDFQALTAAAAFYQEARLPQVVEHFYGLALATPRGGVPLEAWRQAVIGRGLNLMAGMGNAGGAASVFEAELAAGPDQAGCDALLLGLVNARLQQGKRPEAEAASRRLQEKHAGSPYAERARQLLAAKP